MRFLKVLLFILLSFQITLGSISSSYANTCYDNYREVLEVRKLDDTFGVELELLHNDLYTTKEIAQMLANFFRQKGFKDAQTTTIAEPFMPNEEVYLVSYMDQGVKKTWTFPIEVDFFIDHKTKHPGFELTTPIMNGEKDEKLLVDVINYLKEKEIKPARNLGGTHVHWGSNELTYADYIKIYEGYLKAYPVIKKHFAPDEGRGFIEEKYLESTLENLKKLPHAELKHPKEDRNAGNFFAPGSPIRFNLTHDTFETRFFNSSVNAEDIVIFIKFSKRFADKIITDDAFLQRLDTLPIEKIFKEIGF